jgi:hypothetical protein
MIAIKWIADIYKNHGYLAALATLAALVALALAVSLLTGIGLGDMIIIGYCIGAYCLLLAGALAFWFGRERTG